MQISCVAGDFETNASRYEPHELVYTLRAFGHLNYVPPNSGAFFSAVETVLMSKFLEFDAIFILEMLVSFVYIERFPVNFLGHIYSPHFLAQIKGRYLFCRFLHIFMYGVQSSSVRCEGDVDSWDWITYNVAAYLRVWLCLFACDITRNSNESGCVQGSPVCIRSRAADGRPVIGHSYCDAIFNNSVPVLQRS